MTRLKCFNHTDIYKKIVCNLECYQILVKWKGKCCFYWKRVTVNFSLPRFSCDGWFSFFGFTIVVVVIWPRLVSFVNFGGLRREFRAGHTDFFGSVEWRLAGKRVDRTSTRQRKLFCFSPIIIISSGKKTHSKIPRHELVVGPSSIFTSSLVAPKQRYGLNF